jgi:serine/threonine-protein kinase RsbW
VWDETGLDRGGICRSGDRVTLTIPAQAEYLALCRLALAGLGQRCGLDQEIVADLKVAVTEACSCSIRHADKRDTPASEPAGVKVEFGVGDDRWTISVSDFGDVDDEAPSEFGGLLSEDALSLTVIRALVDEVLEVRETERGVLLVMTKRLS